MQTPQSFNWQGQNIGNYRLLRWLGRGTLGEVWLGEEMPSARQSAVKLLPVVLPGEQYKLEALLYQARIAARLDHPHILPMRDAGEQNMGPPGNLIGYLAMLYCSGGSLRDRLQKSRSPLPKEEGIFYLKQAAQAIDHAHSRQILHRNIKPSNLLIEHQQLWLSDFRMPPPANTITQQSPLFTGTDMLDYTAPEQITGHAEPASDRYSLAMVAYQMFTGAVPSRGTAPHEMLKQTAHPLPPPRQFNPALPPAVENFLLRGLSERPAERAPSCVVFVEALEQAWSQTQMPGAGRDSDSTWIAPWSKQYPAREKGASSPEQGKAEPLAGVGYNNAQNTSPIALPSEHDMTLTNSQGVYSPQAALASIKTSDLPKPAGNMQSGEQVWAQPRPQPSLPVAQKRSFNRRALLIGGGVIVVGAAAGAVVLATQHPGKPIIAPRPATTATATTAPGPDKLIAGIQLLTLKAHSGTVRVGKWDPSGRYLATGGEDHQVMQWDIKGHLQSQASSIQTLTQPINTWSLPNSIEDDHLSWSRDGRTLAVTMATTTHFSLLDTNSKSNRTQDYSEQSLASSIIPPPPTYDYVEWAPNDNVFAASSFDRSAVTLWQPGKNTAPFKTLNYSSSVILFTGVKNIHWSPDGTLIAGTSYDFKIIVWRVKTGQVLQTLNQPQKTSQMINTVLRGALVWSPLEAGKLVATDLDSATIWDVQQNKALLTLGSDDAAAYTKTRNSPSNWVAHIAALSWSPNGKYIAGSYGYSNKIYVWDVQNNANSRTKGGMRMPTLIFGEHGHSSIVANVAWSPDGRYLVSTSLDRTAIVWKVDGN